MGSHEQPHRVLRPTRETSTRGFNGGNEPRRRTAALAAGSPRAFATSLPRALFRLLEKPLQARRFGGFTRLQARQRPRQTPTVNGTQFQCVPPCVRRDRRPSSIRQLYASTRMLMSVRAARQRMRPPALSHHRTEVEVGQPFLLLLNGTTRHLEPCVSCVASRRPNARAHKPELASSRLEILPRLNRLVRCAEGLLPVW